MHAALCRSSWRAGDGLARPRSAVGAHSVCSVFTARGSVRGAATRGGLLPRPALRTDWPRRAGRQARFRPPEPGAGSGAGRARHAGSCGWGPAPLSFPSLAHSAEVFVTSGRPTPVHPRPAPRLIPFPVNSILVRPNGACGLDVIAL